MAIERLYMRKKRIGEGKEKTRGHPDLNRGPLDLQSNALPLSYTPNPIRLVKYALLIRFRILARFRAVLEQLHSGGSCSLCGTDVRSAGIPGEEPSALH